MCPEVTDRLCRRGAEARRPVLLKGMILSPISSVLLPMPRIAVAWCLPSPEPSVTVSAASMMVQARAIAHRLSWDCSRKMFWYLI